jgi:hypothetical protein
MAKITFQMIVFNGDYVLEQVLQSILPFGPLVVTEGPVDYWRRRGFLGSTDRTLEILEEYRDYGQGILGVVSDTFFEKDQMMNAPLHLVPDDTTHLWMVDSDEVYKPSDVELIIDLLDMDGYDSVEFKPYSFYGGFDYYMTGHEINAVWRRIQPYYPGAKWATHRPPTIPLLDDRRKRVLGGRKLMGMGVRIYHYSYVFPSQVRAKTDYYFSRSPSRTIPDYFNRVYLPWVLEKREEVEDEYDGVHELWPIHRGPCRTERFEGEHPEVISLVIDSLQERLDEELEKYT